MAQFHLRSVFDIPPMFPFSISIGGVVGCAVPLTHSASQHHSNIIRLVVNSIEGGDMVYAGSILFAPLFICQLATELLYDSHYLNHSLIIIYIRK